MSLRDWFATRADGRAMDVDSAAARIEAEDVGANDGVTMRRAGAGAATVIAAVLVSIYADEGGYVDHKADRGGKTRYGITERVARAWGYQGHMRDFPKHCDADTPICADRIYTTDYIDKPGFRPMAELSPAVLHEMVNSAVLHGPGRSSIWFYRALNSRCGGNLRPRVTVKWDAIAAFKGCQLNAGEAATCRAILNSMDAQQLGYFNGIVRRDPSQRVFYRGWTRKRINNVPRSQCDI